MSSKFYENGYLTPTLRIKLAADFHHSLLPPGPRDLSVSSTFDKVSRRPGRPRQREEDGETLTRSIPSGRDGVTSRSPDVPAASDLTIFRHLPITASAGLALTNHSRGWKAPVTQLTGEA